MSTEEVETPPAASGSSQFSGTFADFGLPEAFHQGLVDLGYTAPTIVQRAVYEPVREGRDVIVQSKTGSGKTTAFCLPVLSRLDPAEKRVQAITLCPTRELAVQVATEASRLGRHTGLKVAAIYGGASIRGQMDALEAGVHFVVGTPGRVLDLIRRGVLKLGRVRFAVLDEADEMLSMGFWDEVTSILDQLSKDRQTLLFSATLPPAVERAASIYLKNPARVDLSTDSINVSTIRHIYHVSDDRIARPRNFLYVLELHAPRSAIVFCNRRDETELLARYLQRFGYRVEALNGDMTQGARESVLAKVKAGQLDLMVATDVAARGIDITDLGHVFNYDLPEFDEVYVHRVGRTGRIGKLGTAVSLVRGRYLPHLTSLKKTFGVPFEEVALPDEKEILWMQAERIAAMLIEAADGVEIDQYRPVAAAMLERGDVKEILAFLLRTHYANVERREPAGEGERRPPEGRDGPRGRSHDRPPPRERGPRREGPRADGPRGDAPRADGPRVDGDRPPPRERGPVEDAPIDDSASANLYVTLGRVDGPTDLIGLAQLMGELSGVDVAHFTGAGDLRDHSSHIEVDTEVADQIVAGVVGKRRPGAEKVEEYARTLPPEEVTKKLTAIISCERARPKPRRSGGGRDGGRDGGGRGGGGRRPRRS
jgi:ATP-dependent RNA helicase DeaD